MENYEQKLFEYLENVARNNASDLHLSAGRAATLRVDGELVPMTKEKILTPQDTEGLAGVILNDEKNEALKKNKSVDLSYSYKNVARFRVNVYYQFGAVSLAFRFIPAQVKTVQELGLPDIVSKFANYQQGLVLIAGPAGHGKSTTLAALIEQINNKRAEHIITIEDPIEYIFTQDKSIIDQREVGRDTLGFKDALRDSFRQDPDIIMLGEMRDPETISTAVTAAETGHLVLATLHTNNSAQTINRIIDSFPPEQQQQIKAQLALTLIGVVSQRLVPKLNGGIIPAVEVLIANPAVRNMIREGKVHEIGLVIETGGDEGMISFNRYLSDMVKEGKISMEVAESYSLNSRELRSLLK
ncbi:MAG: type IV pili twitching motility protein PilT [Candidatus Spechtbacteria bacterium RIFCSPLOWO2_12_FULL_38_22]|uniref:Type IV pili twitching motility protein PilT n=1 Tax=Candidatus Spechtbacteria bacterium RIFCSPLOWO2_12_FULL_38_22 TaxID=1802165 RepID=A0A1G2HG79_9BACT|nr:MAG: type IV pili twitching motility protein PilT [Candidatus Spechtbacteria bacterium RIFCSPHIGHO2_01_FULL_38_11]OGZ59264.1 MAG: type IV pili twitching motility protein PilT [Candidatus Spechtbacteria bacterium RIFCSPLOWO2_01_FULL_38_20]OGZ60272.1 MAG: type IV pili twitching motility protein PilT [Candidatus Spechtbacteria bacterium RIFCSPHIGHO2_12_FULL_38_30]OGZ61515.1 MAG: type IV pili twitching motility protein PilT [Candidatus Spechtbacteria bacterium RIFCSPLOWO2_12_FULL_38_22]